MKASKILMNSQIPNKDKFGIYLKSRRRELELSIRDFATKLNISAAYACDIENGKKAVTKNFAEKAVQALKVEETDIPYFYDLSGIAASNWPDINEYLAKTPKAREFLRLAKQNNLSDKEISQLILSINQNSAPIEEDLML